MIELSKRLHAIALEVPAGSRLADIGSDHALLPVFLAQRNTVVAAIAGELNPGPFAAAAKQVHEAGLQNRIDVRKGDGLSVLNAGEADVITIAGMGGSLMARILNDGVEKLAPVKRLVLQPNVGEDAVRRWLIAHDWWLSRELILEEDGKIYEVLVADRIADAGRRNETLYTVRDEGGLHWSKEWLLQMGPYLSRRREPVFIQKWVDELRKREMIVHQLEHSSLPSAADKRLTMQQEMTFIKEVLACSPTDKPSSR